MSKKNKNCEKKEIIYNIINSLLAGILVLLGALTSGNISIEGFAAATVSALIVAIAQFKKYWDSEEKDYCKSKKGLALFTFIK